MKEKLEGITAYVYICLMKTGVIMKSPDRVLFGVPVRQDTKTGFLNLTDLQEAYARERIAQGWSDRRVSDILSGKFNTERIFYLLEKQGYINTDIAAFIEMVEQEGLTTTLKKVGSYKTTGARNTKTTWTDPYIWVLIAMEMNPKLYGQTVIWLTDGLLANRIEAGNFCKALNSAIQKFKPDRTQYAALAKALNHIIFGRHEAGIRNTGTKDELRRLAALEEKMAFAVDMEYITSFDMLLFELRKIWVNNHSASKQISNP